MNRPPNDADLLPTLLNRAKSITARIGGTEGPRGCWRWVGAFTQNGYGTYSVTRRRSVRAHRAVFMLHHGRPIATARTLHHTCFNTWCVNPAHLVELTQDENVAAGAWGGGSVRYRPTSRGVPRWASLFRENGKQRSRVFATPGEAQAFIDERRATVRGGA